jgi:phage tail sheath protein FI
MPSALTYPGVYIEEIPSGVRTIVGVGTSIAAFVGRTKRGPVNEPIVINSYGDFEQRFGGLWKGSMLGYAVRDFYLNGGSQAVIVRLFSPTLASDPLGQKLHDEARALAKTAAETVAKAATDAAAAGKDVTNVLMDVTAAAVKASKSGPAAAAAAKAVVSASVDVGTKDKLEATIPSILLATELAAQKVIAGGGDADGVKVVADAIEAANTTEATVLSVVAAATSSALSTTGTAAKVKAAATVAEAAIEASTGKTSVTASIVADMANAAVEPAIEAVADDVAPQRSSSRIPVGDDFTLQAANEGLWGRCLRVAIDFDVTKSTADSMGLQVSDLFNVTIKDLGSGQVEQFRNVTGVSSTRRIDRVLKAQSSLVRFWGDIEGSPPNFAKARDSYSNFVNARDKLRKVENNNPTPDSLAAARKEADTATAQYNKDRTDAATEAERVIDAAKPSEVSGAEKILREILDGFGGSDGNKLNKDDFTGVGFQGRKIGLYSLDGADLFNILCIPPYDEDSDIDKSLVADAAQYCERRRAMLLVDPPLSWVNKENAKAGIGSIGTNSKNAALFFPRLQQPDPLSDGQPGSFVPCGAVAGIFARTDTTRGVWKAPAGFEATLVGVPQLSVPLTDGENGELNPLGINCLRSMPAAGRIVWGSRTLQGDDRLASEWKYIPVRRTALFIEESLYRGTHWVVFEPNDEPLWAQIRLNVGAFMNDLFRQGAFQGQTPREAYFVKCDKETTTQNDIDKGIVNILVGFAPLKPAEFVVIKLQQIAGDIQT